MVGLKKSAEKCIISVILVVCLICSVVSSRITSDKVIKNNQCGGDDGKNLENIRDLMQNSNYMSIHHPIAAYIVPTTDAHNSEYVGEHDKRVKFLSKFTGSAGTIVITQEKAALWTDSRYFLQAEQEIDEACWSLMKAGVKNVPSVWEWINKNNNISNSFIGTDPFVMSASNFKELKMNLKMGNNTLIGIERNLVDAIWKNQPPITNNPIYRLDSKFTGESVENKVKKLRKSMINLQANATIISALDDISWLLNLRGSDILFSPIFYSFVILSLDDLELFINNRSRYYDYAEHFIKENATVKINDYSEIIQSVSHLVNSSVGKIIISKDINQAIFNVIPFERMLSLPSIVGRMKAIKNTVEAKNMREAHIRDGLALIKFLHWLESEIDNGNITEMSAAQKLNKFRSEQENFKGLSFETISAIGSHAAMAHYSPSKETDREITRNEIYLVDSGGQYLDGTTDVTRTMHFGQPTAYEKDCFTRVLKGFIALVTSVFPENTSLNYFDYIARRYLWQVGRNYGHGTGHGVGAFLGVHEYPPSINSAAGADPGALENMFTSNEPGYYEDGKFGIRLEDVIQVVKSDLQKAFNENGALTFRTITFVPIQAKMIDTCLLTREEEIYLNDYHQMILDTIGSLLMEQNQTETYNWLKLQTKPIYRNEHC